MARKETDVAQFFGQVSRFIIYGILFLYFLFQTWISVDEYTRYRKSRAISQEGKADLVSVMSYLSTATMIGCPIPDDLDGRAIIP